MMREEEAVRVRVSKKIQLLPGMIKEMRDGWTYVGVYKAVVQIPPWDKSPGRGLMSGEYPANDIKLLKVWAARQGFTSGVVREGVRESYGYRAWTEEFRISWKALLDSGKSMEDILKLASQPLEEQ